MVSTAQLLSESRLTPQTMSDLEHASEFRPGDAQYQCFHIFGEVRTHHLYDSYQTNTEGVQIGLPTLWRTMWRRNISKLSHLQELYSLLPSVSSRLQSCSSRSPTALTNYGHSRSTLLCSVFRHQENAPCANLFICYQRTYQWHHKIQGNMLCAIQ